MQETKQSKQYDSSLTDEQDNVFRTILRIHAAKLSEEESGILFEAVDKIITTAIGQAYAIGLKEGRTALKSEPQAQTKGAFTNG